MIEGAKPRESGDAGPDLSGGPTSEVRASVVVDAPASVVWSVVHDPELFPEAIDWVSEAWTADGGPLEEGSVYFERAKPGLREGVFRWDVVAFEPPHRSAHYHRSGELEARLEVLVDPVDPGRTRYTQVLHFRFLPAFRPLGYLLERLFVRRSMQRDFEGTILPNFKRLAETRAAAVT